MPSNRAPNKRLFIGSLPYKMSEGELLTLFVPFGRIISLRIMRNRWGRSRGLGFIEFDTLEAAVEAKTKMHGYKITDRSIIVDYAEPDPYNTPEGLARHEAAQARHPHPAPTASSARPAGRTNLDQSRPSPSYGTSPKKFFTPQRQSVYDSRTHHSNVGAKFSARNKKAK